tara:strand:- start:5888 stop:6436 length:549 start_codon:yes stop_codon:yes gene_type:complete
MSRSLSNTLLTQLANPTNTFCFLLEINTSTVFRLTDNQFDVTYDSNTYSSSGEIISVDTTPETGELKVEETSIVLSNINSTLISVFDDQNYIDNTVNIYLGFFDNNNSFIDAFTYFSGNIKNVEVDESARDSKITVTCSNHWSNWNLKQGRHFTDESQQLAFTSDKGLEYAHVTKSNIRWGS